MSAFVLRFRAGASVAALATLLATPAIAHDPVASPATTPATSGRHTLTASSPRFELVMKNDALEPGEPGRLDLYLNDFETNAPIAASIVLDVRGESGRSVWRGEAAGGDSGVYSATLTAAKGTYNVLAVVTDASGAKDEFALSGLEVGAAHDAADGTGARAWWPWVAGGLLLLVLVALFAARRRRATPAAAALIGSLLVLGPARAHEGHDRAPVAAGAPVSPGAIVHMPKESQFLLGVRTQRATIERVQKRLSVLGRVAPRGGSELEVVAPSLGRVFFPGNRAPVIGQRIGRGAVVARLVVVDALLLRAPLGGVVTSVHVAHGQLVQPGQKIVTVLDPSVVWVHGDVFESDLAGITGARRALITSPAYPDRTFEGRAVALGATQGDVPGAVEAWFEVPNPAGLLKIGAVVEVGIEQGRADSALVLPRSAVVEKDGRRLVFVHTSPEEFTAREVMITTRLGERVAVRGTLEPGERVVVIGGQSLLAAPVIGMGR